MDPANPYAPPAANPPAAIACEPLDPPQTVSFEMNEDDLNATLRELHASSTIVRESVRKARRQLLLAGGVILALAAITWNFGGDGDASLSVYTGALGALGVWFLISSTRVRRNIEKKTSSVIQTLIEEARESHVLGPRTCTIDAEGVRSVERAGDGFRCWWATHGLERTDDYLFIYETKNSAAPLPARAFVNEERFAAFCDLAERLWSEGQTAQPADAATGG